MTTTRLDRLLSESGRTRREAKELLRAGRVSVNGAPERDGSRHVDASADDVRLDGERLGAPGETHIMLNKPAGVLTAAKDARERTVFDLLPEALRARGLGPVGRLDRDVTGLLLLTTDGQLAHRLISPRWAQEKRYEALVEGEPDEADAARLAQGVALSDFVALPALLTVRKPGERSLCELVIREGKYHQVKRMFGAIGHPVVTLSRREVAGLALDPALAPGQWRELTPAEAASLYARTQLAPPL